MKKERPLTDTTTTIEQQPWDGSPANYTDEQYAAACVLDRADCGESDLPAKERYSLPIKAPGSDSVDAQGLAAAAQRFSQVEACPKAKQKAARRLAAAYRELDMEPPEALLEAAGGSQSRTAPEQRTVTADVSDMRAEGNTLRGFAAVYGVESRDLGGFREVIQPGAFASVLQSRPDVLLTFNHDPSRVLARTSSGTLRLRDEERGLAFEAELGDGPTAQDVRDMVRRGDVRGASFRFRVAHDGERWQGERRTLTRIGDLIDLSLATTPAYDGPTVELRSRPITSTTTTAAQRQEANDMNDGNAGGEESRAGTLRVEDRNGPARTRGLAEEFRSRGFPGEVASLTWDEYRTASFTGSVDDLNPTRQVGVMLGADQRYAYPAFPMVAEDAATTSVQVLRQSSRTLPSAADVVRDIDETSAKPEVATVTEVVPVSLQQVAAVETGIPNVILAQPTVETLIQTDLRLALNEGLDKLVVDAFAASPNQDPASDELLVSIRKAITVVQAAGYNPDTLILRPEDAEEIDTLVTGISGGTADFVFGAGRFAPGQLFGLNVRISKSVDAPTVADAAAFGKLYISPITLARFEEDAGSTNQSTVRLEGHAAFGVERQDAACEILGGS